MVDKTPYSFYVDKIEFNEYIRIKIDFKKREVFL